MIWWIKYIIWRKIIHITSAFFFADDALCFFLAHFSWRPVRRQWSVSINSKRLKNLAGCVSAPAGIWCVSSPKACFVQIFIQIIFWGKCYWILTARLLWVITCDNLRVWGRYCFPFFLCGMTELRRLRSEDLVAYHDCDRSQQVCSLDNTVMNQRLGLGEQL